MEGMDMLALFFCFLPLVIIFIVMKVVLLLGESHRELTYVRQEPNRERGPYLDDVYGDAEDEDDWS